MEFLESENDLGDVYLGPFFGELVFFFEVFSQVPTRVVVQNHEQEVLVLEAAVEFDDEGVVYLTEDVFLGEGVLNQVVVVYLFLLQNLHGIELVFVGALHQVDSSKGALSYFRVDDEVGERHLLSGLDVGRENEVPFLLRRKVVVFEPLNIRTHDDLQNPLLFLRVAEIQTAFALVIFDEEIDLVEGLEKPPNFVVFLEHGVMHDGVAIVVSVVQVVDDAREHLDDLDFAPISGNHDGSDAVVVGQVEVDVLGDEEVEEREVLVEDGEVCDLVSVLVLVVEIEVGPLLGGLFNEGLDFLLIVLLDGGEEAEGRRSFLGRLFLLFGEVGLFLLELHFGKGGVGVEIAGIVGHADVYFGILLRLAALLGHFLGQIGFFLLRLGLLELGHVQLREEFVRRLALFWELVIGAPSIGLSFVFVKLELVEAFLAVIDVLLHEVHAALPLLLRVLFLEVERLLRRVRAYSFLVIHVLFVE